MRVSKQGLKIFAAMSLLHFLEEQAVLKILLNQNLSTKTEVENFNNNSKNGWKDEKVKTEKKVALDHKYNEAKKNLRLLEKFKSEDSHVTQKILELYNDEVEDYKIDKIEKIKENIIPDKQIKVEYNDKVV